MASTKPFVFISCGQYRPHEKQLGLDIKKAIENLTPFEAYFAEAQSSANGLVANIFERLYHCAGFVAVMHARGQVRDDRGSGRDRGSLWIEQEIAIISFIRNVARKDTEIKIAAYAHPSIKLEGIRQLIQLNPTPFDKDDEILPDLCLKLASWRLSASTAMETQRWERWKKEMDSFGPDHIGALRFLMDGQSQHRSIINRLKEIGLALHSQAILEAPPLRTFVQAVPGQPHASREHGNERMYEIKPESREFLEHYFEEHPQQL